MKKLPKQKMETKRKGFNCPWMTKGLVKSSKEKQRLFAKFLKNRKPGNIGNITSKNCGMF